MENESCQCGHTSDEHNNTGCCKKCYPCLKFTPATKAENVEPEIVITKSAMQKMGMKMVDAKEYSILLEAKRKLEEIEAIVNDPDAKNTGWIVIQIREILNSQKSGE